MNESFFTLRCSKTSLVENTGCGQNGETRNRDTRKAQIRIHLQLAIQKPFYEHLQCKPFYRQAPTPPEEFFKASQNSQEITCAGVCLSLETLLKSGLSTSVFLWRLQIFSKQLSCRASENECFCVNFFSKRVSKIPKNV